MNLLRTLKIHQFIPCLKGIYLTQYLYYENLISDLIPYTNSKYGETIFYIDKQDKLIMELDDNNTLWISENLDEDINERILIFLSNKIFKNNAKRVNYIGKKYCSKIENVYKSERR